MGRVRLQDVAEASGVSIATVSIVLSGNRERRISTTTCGRVRAAAESLGYAGPPAQPPVRGLGVLLDTDGDVVLGAEFLEAIQNAARSIGSPPVLSTHVHRRGATQFAGKSLRRRGADSLIFVSKSFQSLVDLHDVPRRAAFINCVPGPAVPQLGSWTVVLPDHRHLAEGVAERLIRQGHVRLLLVSSHHLGDPVATEWITGVQAEAATWAPAATVEVVAVAAPDDLPSAVAAALDKPAGARPSAVIALEASSTSAVLEAGSRLGLTVPDELVLVTRSAEHSPTATPSTIVLPPSTAELAAAAVDALATASPWHAGEVKPRMIRVRHRHDPWRPDLPAAARSA
ncbi:MAG: LacI family DNA-binding transcriptional regulator [Actinobacteria bacterium]|nr:LacI family DNA-binding transcriptional regulator [Actinomycetota bacterium]